jgi:hypothetical protein
VPTSDYHFLTYWRGPGTFEEVKDVLADPQDLHRWWPSVYLDVQQLSPGDKRGLGREVALQTKGWLPYMLRRSFKVTEVHSNGLTLVAEGDFTGRGIWTYHTALAMAQAAKLLKWTCKFETLGKRDAILETLDKDPLQLMLVAEWEWDSSDAFGAGKELDKLMATCREHPSASAYLLTFCSEAQYPAFIQRVVDEWCPEGSHRQDVAAGLYLHTLIYTERASFREFECLRTAAILPGYLKMWCDELFD